MVQQPFIEIPLKIETLTPVHIGTGDDYYPTDYVIKNGKLYFLDRSKFTHHVKEEGKWEDFCNVSQKSGKEAIFEIRKFISGIFDGNPKLADICSLYSVDVSQGTSNIYNENIQSTNSQNQLEIQRMYRSGIDLKPVIPGSSVKGAFMTALSNYIKEDVSRNHDFGKLIKFSDFSFVGGKESVEVVHNSKNISLKNDRELILANSTFLGKVQFNSILNRTLSTDKDRWGNLTKNKLCSDDFEKDFFYILNNFYELNEESKDIMFQSILDFEKQNFNLFFKEEISLENSSLIKLGCHSGAYAVTLHPEQEGNIFNNQLFETVKKLINDRVSEVVFKQKIEETKAAKVIHKYKELGHREFINKLSFNGRCDKNAKRDKMFYMSHQTTTWITEEVKPLGWCRASAISQEEHAKYLSLVNKRRSDFELKLIKENKIYQEFLDKEQEKGRIEQQKIEEQQKQEELRKQKQIAEKIKLESMSEVDRICYQIANYDVSQENEQVVMKEFSNIDNFSSEDKIKLAKAIKKYFLKADKWDVKQGKKQYDKVQKIKQILEE